MFVAHPGGTLISMSELRAGTPLVDWSDVGVSELPLGAAFGPAAMYPVPGTLA